MLLHLLYNILNLNIGRRSWTFVQKLIFVRDFCPDIFNRLGREVMHINLIGQTGSTGIGNHFSHFSKGLEQVAGMGHRVRQVPGGDIQAIEWMCSRRPLAKQASIFFWGGFSLFQGHLDNLAGRKIVWCVFEQTSLPQMWLDVWALFDEVWVPSDWGRRVLIANGLDPQKAVVMPEGVDTKVYRPLPKLHDKFRFLVVGKYEGRKSVDETIVAFNAAFPPDDNEVELWLKCDYFGRPDRVEELGRKISADPRIRLLTGSLTPAELADLYNSVDAFVFPSKAEGFGLPGLEALSCGLPSLVLNYSGQSQYYDCFKDHFRPIDFSMVPLDDPDYESLYRKIYGEKSMGEWAMPNQQSMIEGMQDLRRNANSWRDKAMAITDDVARQFDWTAIARMALNHLLA